MDFSNAFNCLHRDFMLTRVGEMVSELDQFCHLVYSQHCTLQFDELSISSEDGPQQGESTCRASLLSGITSNTMVYRLPSQLAMGFMYDVSLGNHCPPCR